MKQTLTLVKKNAVREEVDGLNVGSDVYEEVDEAVRDILDRASERAEENGRRTVKARDI